MCDTVAVVTGKGPSWFAKNSDREPGEAQFVECDPGDAPHTRPARLPAIERPHQVLQSRPAWMWGAEMGVNQHGLAIGNEAVFTRLPVPKEGVSGMDFVRLTLGNCRTADDALEQLIELTERVPQGGPMGHRNRRFRYNSSFIVVDCSAGWVFETAGQLWAAKRIEGVATISNELTIEDDFDRVHGDAYSVARKHGWTKAARAFSFAGAFSDPFVSAVSGARVRRACTRRALEGVRTPQARDFVSALSDHGGTDPLRGWRGVAPCAHASWMPTRWAQQTTGSMVAHLTPGRPKVWSTGTSSPCLSVFKPTTFDPALFPVRRVADAGFDPGELWWAHERLHRTCLRAYHARRVAFAEDRERFQDACLDGGQDAAKAWSEHRSRVDEWLERARSVEPGRLSFPTRLYWELQARWSALPA